MKRSKKNNHYSKVHLISKEITALKGLYIPTRIENDVLSSSECIDHVKYKEWQNFFLKNNKNICVKPHPKQVLELKIILIIN